MRSAILLFVSGQAGIDPSTRRPAGKSFRDSVKNLDAVLRAGGSNRALVASTTVLVAGVSSFDELNELFGEFFSVDPPARMTMQVPLPLGLLLSIGCVAEFEA